MRESEGLFVFSSKVEMMVDPSCITLLLASTVVICIFSNDRTLSFVLGLPNLFYKAAQPEKGRNLPTDYLPPLYHSDIATCLPTGLYPGSFLT